MSTLRNSGCTGPDTLVILGPLSSIALVLHKRPPSPKVFIFRIGFILFFDAFPVLYHDLTHGSDYL